MENLTLEERIIELLSHGVNQFNLLNQSLFVKKPLLQAKLDEMVRSEQIVFDKYLKGYFALKKATLDLKDGGYAFARVEGEDKDYYIPREYLDNNIYNGDTCLVYPYEKGVRLLNAKIYKIIDRRYKYVIGVLKESIRKKGPKYYINSNILDFHVKVEIDHELIKRIDLGVIVYADIVYVGSKIKANSVTVVGHKDDPGIEISQIALEYGFKTEFSKETIEELNLIPDEVTKSEIINRRDFRNKTVITIDGDDSKDYDDAVYMEKIDDIYHLEVYIADVSHYVVENQPLDIDAISRGTSVYLADRVIPMLPRKLSNGICSLNEGVDRLVLACLMDIDYKGNLVNYEIVEGVINSHHRMTYNNVNKILDGDSLLIDKYSDIVDMLKTMKEASDIIRNRRYKKGGLEFETDEYKFTLNDDGSPKDVTLRTRGDAEKLIEDFMLMANETVAYHMSISNLPCVFRIHEKPDQEKLHNVFSLINNMGVKTESLKNDIHPKEIQKALEQLDDNPYAPIINTMLLRSMMKAKYSEKCVGHYGLALNYYCHFTSPIRRYPDLLTHRIIHELLINPKNFDDDLKHFESLLPEAALKCSSLERLAIECERSVDDMLYAWFMENHIYERFCGIITSVTSFGMFVSLDNGVEGLIPYQNMDGYFEYNDKLMSASDGRITYKLGDKVDVVLVYSNKKTRKIEFVLEEDFHF